MLDRILFGVLLAICLVVLGTLLVNEAPNSYGVDHPAFEDMKQGGSGAQRHGRLIWLGLAFGGLQILFFTCCLRLGASSRSRCAPALAAGCLLYLAVFTAMMMADRNYAQTENPALVFSFPLPTALMLYGLFPVPLIFTLLYVVFYERWIVNPEDLRRFQETLRAHRQSESHG